MVMKLPAGMPAPFGALKPINRAPEEVVKEAKRFPKEEVVKAARQPVTLTAEPSEPHVVDVPTVTDALSYIYAKTIQQLSKETGLPKAKLKKEINRLWAGDYLEERNGYYRYQNAGPWKTSSI
jgi:hypothetical protein